MATYVDPYKSFSANNPTSTASNTYSSTNTNSNEKVDGTRTTNSNVASTNMDPNSLLALQAIIKQLATGGTPAIQQQNAQKQAEIASLVKQRAGYSKEAAFADATGLMAKTMRDTLEKLLPSINSGARGAGASQSSMRALLTQQAAEHAAENASAQGLNAAIGYGGVANNMSSILSGLLTSQDPAMAALLQALNIAKGAVTNTNSSSTENSSSNATKDSTSNQTITEAKRNNYNDTAPFTVGGFGQLGGETQSYRSDVGSTTDLLRQLASNNTFSNYTF